MQKVDIEISTDSYNFWWSEYGFTTSHWQDFHIYYNLNGKDEHHGVELLTTEYYRQEKFYNKEDELEENGLPEEDWHLTVYGITEEKLMATKELVFGYWYSDNRDEEDFYEITDYPVDLPTYKGMKPRYIGGVTPRPTINKEVAIEFVTAYMKKFLLLEVGEVKFRHDTPFEEAKKQWEEELADRKRNEEFIKSGGKYEIIYAPTFMDSLYGKKIMEKYGDSLKLAKPIEGTKEILLEFKDGHTEIFDPEAKEWE